MIKSIIFSILTLVCLSSNDKCAYANYTGLKNLTFSESNYQFESASSLTYPDATYINDKFYFENCINNFHSNSEGVCGIVAAQIILNYFDTFYNDDLIDEKYDFTGYSYTSYPDFETWPSPGSGDSLIYNDSTNFFDVLLDMSNQFFFSRND